mmetsp:Transcript_64943/g.154949  ORF Transcript_64943/g.154949 Transcript_64943/m.154949 type:complete len:90 (+) Transcript_64943:225-494(+)
MAMEFDAEYQTFAAGRVGGPAGCEPEGLDAAALLFEQMSLARSKPAAFDGCGVPHGREVWACEEDRLRQLWWNMYHHQLATGAIVSDPE